MCNFIAIIDPNRDRRSSFIKVITPLLAPVPNLEIDSCSTETFHAIWAANPTAPIDYTADAQGASVIWGEALTPSSHTRVSASNLKNLNLDDYQTLLDFDGYYAAIAYSPLAGLRVSADLLGLFPVYYWTRDEVCLVASSPELFRHHPLFKPEFNPEGLAGILLINGLVEGQTLWKNVKRLNARHLLSWQPHQSAVEIEQYDRQLNLYENDYANLSLSESLELMRHTLDRVIKRHVPSDQKYAILLSGGLDSRMIAGFLDEQGIQPTALTFGDSSDIEMQCALSVARTLRLKHKKAPIKLSSYRASAHITQTWEHLANGFNGPMYWQMQAHTQNLAQRVITGYSVDRIIGGTSTYYLPLTKLSFDTFFSLGINRWGLTPDLLNRLLRKDIFGDSVEKILFHLRAAYENTSSEEFKRTWFFELSNRQRFHIGATYWRLSFGAWPVIPYLDRELLKTVISLPTGVMAERLIQKELVCHYFPKLAQLPLDRNSFDIKPLKPDLENCNPAKRSHIFSRLRSRWSRLQRKLGVESRYYYRIYDINNRGWHSVRTSAEPYRKNVEHLLQKSVLDELLPQPSQKISFEKDSITEGSGRKALLGFLLWSKDNL